MRVAVLIKQVPLTEQVRFADGRLVREGVDLEVNPYCRRANAKAVELAGPGGEVVVFTMAPPAGDDALREMIACGASRGVHLCDPAFAGSDTLATARALARAIEVEGPFDLVLAGLNSVDADTGQVGPEVAELLGLPFAAGVRQLALTEGGFRAQLEEDTGHRTVEGPLPAVLSAAERLCDPSKAPPPARAEVPAERIRVVTAAALALEPHEVGTAGSPTVVGPVSAHVVSRRGLMATSAAEAVRLLDGLGAFEDPEVERTEVVPQPVAGRGAEQGPDIWCFLEPGVDADHTLLGEAAVVATQVGGRVTAVAPEPVPEGLGPRGADRVLAIPDADEPEQWSEALTQALAERSGELPWAVLFPASRAGRTVAATVAARLGWGLTGDAIALEVSPEGRLVALKPAFGGQLIAAIHSRSPVQLVSVRPGVLDRRRPRVAVEPEPTSVALALRGPGRDRRPGGDRPRPAGAGAGHGRPRGRPRGASRALRRSGAPPARPRRGAARRHPQGHRPGLAAPQPPGRDHRPRHLPPSVRGRRRERPPQPHGRAAGRRA